MTREESVNELLNVEKEDLEKTLAKLSLKEIEDLIRKIEEAGDYNE